MDKIPCTKCGVLILPETAERTGGICMACKQGIRESIEGSRAYYQSLKEYDPSRALWLSLVNRSSGDPSLDSFSPQERRYFAMWLLVGDVDNGGFDQYFFNSSGDYYRFAVSGLEEISATHALALLKQAAAILLGKHEPPTSRTDRWRIMDSKTRRFVDIITGRRRETRLARLDSQFYEDRDGLEERLAAYAKDRGLIDPFEKDPN